MLKPCMWLKKRKRMKNVSGNAVREDERRGGGSSDRNRGGKGLLSQFTPFCDKSFCGTWQIFCAFVTKNVVLWQNFVWVLWEPFCQFCKDFCLHFYTLVKKIAKVCFPALIFFSHLSFFPFQEAGQTNNLNLLLISQLYKPYFSGKRRYFFKSMLQ